MIAMTETNSSQTGGGNIGLIQNATTLLSQHGPLLRRRAVIIARLDRLEATRSVQTDEKISEMALGRRIMDGLPKARRTGSATEHIALNYSARLQSDMKEEVRGLAGELAIIELNLAIYDAMIKSLSTMEALLVRLHYDEGMTFARITENPGTARELQIYSSSTLKRLNQRILSKIDDALRDCDE